MNDIINFEELEERAKNLSRTLTNLLYESFEFQSSSFEVYENGMCIDYGSCNTFIRAKVLNNTIKFSLLNNDSIDIDTSFSFQFYKDDLLNDRIQYGRLPVNFNIGNSTLPVVCNIFPNKNIIRFALLSPLRVIEFTGTIKKL